MSAAGNGFGGGGGFPAMSVGMPGAPQQQAAAPSGPPTAFVLVIPPDPTWEPFETTDVLEQDGIYACRVTKESGRTDSSKKAGVFLSLQVLDEAAKGKNLSKFMSDPRGAKNDIWWTWRALIRSITGTLDHARGGLSYQTGMFTGQLVYVKTNAYLDERDVRTGVDGFVTKDEYEAAVKAGAHRWKQKVSPGGTGLPTGLPGGGFPAGSGAAFPGMGLPGAPVGAMGGVGAPPPAAASPMVPPPAPSGFAPPVVTQQVAPPPAPAITAGFPGFPTPKA
jgi:hypothetical protein